MIHISVIPEVLSLLGETAALHLASLGMLDELCEVVWRAKIVGSHFVAGGFTGMGWRSSVVVQG